MKEYIVTVIVPRVEVWKITAKNKQDAEDNWTDGDILSSTEGDCEVTRVWEETPTKRKTT